MNFALISEGITDQVVIEAIINAYYKDSDEEVTVNHLQPMRDATDQSRQSIDTHGGWKNVFEYISTDDKCASALETNDKLIIQVDSDICWHDSVPIDPKKDHEILFDEIKNLLISKIPADDFKWIKDYLIFAIPIHSTECWLIPIYTQKASILRRVNDCENQLKQVEQNSVARVEKNFDCYEILSAKIRRPKDIEIISKHSKSLYLFTQQLPKTDDKNIESQ